MTTSEQNMNAALETLQGRIGESTPPTDWLEITQDRIQAFADVTLDQQWIHIDVDRATAGPFGAPIAHGHLTLSIMGHLPRTEAVPGPALEGQKLGINYGFDKVRFINPVLSGRRVRAHSTIKSVELKGSAINQTRTFTVEIEGDDKPALLADWIGRMVFDS